MTGFLRRLRGMLCPILGHRYIGDEHRRLCVYCWREERIRTFPGADDGP